MTELSEFSLGPSSSAVQKWFGNDSQLFRDGKPIPLHVEGSVLRHQFHTTQGYLFITDYDCPFEEITHITLCSHDFHLLSRRSFMGLFSSYPLDRMECLDHERLLLDFGPKQRWLLSLRPRGFPYLRPRIQLARVRGKASNFVPDVVA
jgi:hypothetical protein